MKPTIRLLGAMLVMAGVSACHHDWLDDPPAPDEAAACADAAEAALRDCLHSGDRATCHEAFADAMAICHGVPEEPEPQPEPDPQPEPGDRCRAAAEAGLQECLASGAGRERMP
ncbi:MAG: hypothetical protein H6703_00405 [Myxococcales bacterium]|nr:hypothetical protein [Myxococcales bacterium]